MQTDDAFRERVTAGGPAPEAVHAASGERVDDPDGPSGVDER